MSIDKIKQRLSEMSIKDSLWLEEANWRHENREWLDRGFKICVAILSFLRANKMTKETLEQLVGFKLDLRGQYDFKLSEITKIEEYINKKLI